MSEQNVYRKELQQVIEDYGIKLKWIAEKLGWEYTNLTKFKNGQVNLSKKRIEELKKFLSRYKQN